MSAHGRVLTTGLALMVGLSALGCSESPQILSIADGVGVRIKPLKTGTNQGWVEFDTFVLIVDTDIGDPELEFLDAIRATTDKPLRFVIDTHFHGDHAHGNARLAGPGVQIVAAAAARPDYERTENDFAKARDGGNRLFRDLDYAAPTIWHDGTMTIAEGNRRVELLHLGAAHTAGDTLVWLPEEGVLFTGDVVANRHLTYLGDGHIESWIGVLDELEKLPVRVVIPGHGPPGDMETIRTQRSFLTDLRDAVAAEVRAGHTDAEEIAKRIDLPNHPLWREQPQWFRRFGVKRLLPENEAD